MNRHEREAMASRLQGEIAEVLADMSSRAACRADDAGWVLPPERQELRERGMTLTDAMIARLIDEKITATVDAIGAEVGVMHRDMEAANSAQLAELNATLSALSDEVSRLRELPGRVDTLADDLDALRAEIADINGDIEERKVSPVALRPAGGSHAA